MDENDGIETTDERGDVFSTRTLLTPGTQPSVGANCPEGDLSLNNCNQMLDKAYLRLANFTGQIILPQLPETRLPECVSRSGTAQICVYIDMHPKHPALNFLHAVRSSTRF